MAYEEFKVGKVYMAIPSIENGEKKIIVVCGREGRRIQCAWVEDLTIELADSQIGREFISAHHRGEQYVISSSVPIEEYNPVEVAEILTRGRLKE